MFWRRLVVALVAVGLLAAMAVPAAARTGQGPSAQTAKKCKKKGKKSASAVKKKKKKCKKKAAPVIPPATGSGPTTPPPPPPPPPPPDTRTTFQKIDAAAASGEITAEQGLTYKVFASFGDPRLPTKYLGLADPLAEVPLGEVQDQWDQLSDGAKAILGPFLIPPMQEGSYWNQQIDQSAGSPSAIASTLRDDPPNPTQPWCTGNTQVATENWHYVEPLAGPAAGKVRIWVQNRFSSTDDTLAAGLMAAMQSQIWEKVTALMGREPLPDGGSTGSCGGGTDALDIALVDIYPAATLSHTLSQESTSAQMLFPRSRDNSAPYLAHEFTHAIEFRFNLASGDMTSDENRWLRESTAQWVMDYVSAPAYGIGLAPNDTEKNYGALSYFFTTPEKPLDTATPTGRPYSAYLFWLWAIRKSNNTSLVGQAWNNAGTQKSLEATKSLFGSGWDQAWKDFTRTNWNRDGINDYQNWDSINNTPAQERVVTLQNTITPVLTTVNPVAAKYLTFIPAAGVNELTFQNIGGLSDKAGVQAIFKYKDGTYGAEDWTGIAQKDVPMCDKDEVTLVLSNSSVTPNDSRAFSLAWLPPSSAPHAGVGSRAANVCVPNPQGSFSGTAHYDDSITTQVDWSWNGTVDFDPADDPEHPPFEDYSDELWDASKPASGSVTLSGSGSSGDCDIDIPGTSRTFGPEDGTMVIQPGPQPHYGIQLHFPDALTTANFDCPDQDPFTGQIPTPPLVLTPDPEQTMSRGTYQGSSTYGGPVPGGPSFTGSDTWSLVDP
jgi:hypothetical protein